jgi:hypothetical protein
MKGHWVPDHQARPPPGRQHRAIYNANATSDATICSWGVLSDGYRNWGRRLCTGTSSFRPEQSLSSEVQPLHGAISHHDDLVTGAGTREGRSIGRLLH